jgi:transposase
MGRSTPNLYAFELTDEQRERLLDITRNGHAPVKKVRHAQVLLWSAQNRPEGRLTRDEIAAALGMHANTVDRIRKRFVQEGEAPALQRKVRSTPPTPPKLDGRGEAILAAVCCSTAPEGRTRWTLHLLADELVKRRVVTSIGIETVRRALKKTSCSRGGRNAGACQNGTRPGSSLKWKTFSTSTKRTIRSTSR